MPRDNHDDEPTPRTKGGFPAWAIALIAGGVFVFCGGGVAAVVGVFWLGLQSAADVIQEEERARQADPKQKMYTRDEFRKLVAGKTTDEVIRLVGPPGSTQDDGSREKFWYYRNRTVDPINGKIDSIIQVIIKDNVVEEVRY